ncbi:hypothetical protein [Pedobacter sp. Leaf176]|uniref:hypothetical protein n=1 Tax=Pedobacter sp. Leaf176 TaxID=1736286 RepID=UPI0012F92F44|nr:hypothetical protein [Pedobacter sp. Leaf176]
MKAIVAFLFIFICLFIQSCKKDRGRPGFLEDSAINSYFKSAKERSRYFLEGGRNYELNWSKVQRIGNGKHSYLIFKVNDNTELVFADVN